MVVVVMVAWLDDGYSRWWWQRRLWCIMLQWLHDVVWRLQSHGLTVGWLWQVVAVVVMIVSRRQWRLCHVVL
jgi:hypothetical protein